MHSEITEKTYCIFWVRLREEMPVSTLHRLQKIPLQMSPTTDYHSPVDIMKK